MLVIAEYRALNTREPVLGGVSKGERRDLVIQEIRAPALPRWLRAGEAGGAPVTKAPRRPRLISLAGGLGNRGGEGPCDMERGPSPPVPAISYRRYRRWREAYVA